MRNRSKFEGLLGWVSGSAIYGVVAPEVLNNKFEAEDLGDDDCTTIAVSRGNHRNSFPQSSAQSLCAGKKVRVRPKTSL